MLHKAEEWKLIRRAPKLKLAKEYERELRLDDESEKKLLVAAAACGWSDHSFELFQDIVRAGAGYGDEERARTLPHAN
jgi:hypothetical protein